MHAGRIRYIPTDNNGNIQEHLVKSERCSATSTRHSAKKPEPNQMSTYRYISNAKFASQLGLKSCVERVERGRFCPSPPRYISSTES